MKTLILGRLKPPGSHQCMYNLFCVGGFRVDRLVQLTKLVRLQITLV